MTPASATTAPVSRGNLFAVVNIILVLTGFFALFFLLTNGIPLVQAGWIKEFGKKNRYVNLMILFVSVFSVLLVIARLRFRELFEAFGPIRIWNWICRLPLSVAATSLFILYATIMTAVGFERHAVLETRAFDLGIFAQAVWNTMQGNFLFSSLKENICLLGDHVSPILLALVPFYKVWTDPRVLILVQAMASASCLFPLAILAEKKLSNRSLSIVFLLMFFFFAPMRSSLHEDFHPEVLAEPFLWWAFLFLDQKKIKWFVLCLLIAVTGKENFLGIAFMLGFYAFFWKQVRWVGALVMLCSAGIFFWETKVLIPYLTGVKYFYGGNYSQMLSHPFSGIVLKLVSAESIGYSLKIFSPFLFLPFFHLPTLMLTFPVLFQNLLSGNGAMRSMNYHYATGLTPFLFISTASALESFRQKKDWFKKHVCWFGFALLIVSVLRSGPSEYFFFWQSHSHRNAHIAMVVEKLRQVPEGGTVLTHNSFVPQLCDRKFIYQFDYIASNTKTASAKKYRADYVIWDALYWEENTLPLPQALADLTANGFHIAFAKDGFYILERNPS